MLPLPGVRPSLHLGPVMQNGALVAEGPTAEVWDDERVRRVYPGDELPFGTVRAG